MTIKAYSVRSVAQEFASVALGVTYVLPTRVHSEAQTLLNNAQTSPPLAAVHFFVFGISIRM